MKFQAMAAGPGEPGQAGAAAQGAAVQPPLATAFTFEDDALHGGRDVRVQREKAAVARGGDAAAGGNGFAGVAGALELGQLGAGEEPFRGGGRGSRWRGG